MKNIVAFDIGSRLTKIVRITPGKFENHSLTHLHPCKSTVASDFPYLTSLLRGELSLSSNSPEENPLRLSVENNYFINFYLIETSYFYINKEKIIEDFPNTMFFITGYGKNNVDFLDNKNITYKKTPELVAHTRGCIYQTGLNDFILLDIGGQDTKVMLCKNGKMADFLTNDKCAASSGRFLENMSKILHIDNIGDYYKNPVTLNSTCAVFSESELIGKLSEGISREILAASVNFALFNRVKKLVIPFLKYNLPLVFVGGLSENKAIIHFIKEELKTNVIIPDFHIFNGSLGAIK
ncbi:MAG: acyl-CoA dehydratase activase [Candidatus Muirbacterium halophilum]|nr:acyl-CoA dehydratase activase [Candidatus Muirbacterium halophilum]